MLGITKLGILAAFTVSSIAMGSVEDRDPVGESAYYKLDRTASRTSSLIQSGELTTHVTRALPDDGSGPAFEVNIDYTFRIQLLGTRTGTETVNVPAAYFTPEFMMNLRQTGHYESAKFKVDHEGYADAVTMDGHHYAHCDKVKIYDIQQGFDDGGVIAVAKSLLDVGGAGPDDQIDNLVIHAQIFEGVPVLGAVKLDVSGRYSGMNVKAGADYQP